MYIWLIHTLLSNHLTKATPQDNTLGIVYMSVYMSHIYITNYLPKATPQDNTLGIVFYDIFLWCIVSLLNILVFFLTSVKEGYILEIQMLIKYSLLLSYTCVNKLQ